MEKVNLENGVYKIGIFTLDMNTRKLFANGNSVRITTKEAELLAVLAANKNNTVGRMETLSLIWGDNNYFTARSMDVYITKLRKFLKAEPSVEIINVHGKGYKMLAE